MNSRRSQWGNRVEVRLAQLDESAKLLPAATDWRVLNSVSTQMILANLAMVQTRPTTRRRPKRHLWRNLSLNWEFPRRAVKRRKLSPGVRDPICRCLVHSRKNGLARVKERSANALTNCFTVKCTLTNYHKPLNKLISSDCQLRNDYFATGYGQRQV